MSAVTEEKKQLVIGILAIQGAVEEHANLVKRCGGTVKEVYSVLFCSSINLAGQTDSDRSRLK